MDQENNNEGEDFVERRRSIRDVTLDEELRGEKARFQRRVSDDDGNILPPRRNRGIKYAGYVIGAFVALVLIFGGFLITSTFSKATITLVPRIEVVTIDEEIVVSEDPGAGLPLAYEVFSIDEEVSRSLEGGDEEEVERKASGRITIYNAESEEDQALVTNTRFESESGNIYRISQSVVVPGIRSDGSPGSLSVTVTSDEAGEEYNLESGRFTIPGLEGTELYDAMYAEVEEPITGGFVGVVQTVDAEDEEDAREENREELQALLDAKIAESLPAEYIFIPESTVVEFTEVPNESSGDAVQVTTRGTLYGVMFRQDLLASYFANQYVDNYDNQPLAIADPASVTFVITDEELELSDIQNELEMTITGSASLVSVVKTDEVKERLAGTARSDFQANATAIPGIRSARLELVPGFMRSIPTNTEKIEILIEEELPSI